MSADGPVFVVQESYREQVVVVTRTALHVLFLFIGILVDLILCGLLLGIGAPREWLVLASPKFLDKHIFLLSADHKLAINDLFDETGLVAQLPEFGMVDCKPMLLY